MLSDFLESFILDIQVHFLPGLCLLNGEYGVPKQHFVMQSRLLVF